MPFPPPLGHRLAYDRDGTVVLFRRTLTLGGDWVEPHERAVQAMASSMDGGVRVLSDDSFWTRLLSAQNTFPNRFGLVFPEPMRLTGVYCSIMFARQGSGSVTNRTVPTKMTYSTDTTNLSDGSWETWPTKFESAGPHSDYFDPAFVSGPVAVDVLTGSGFLYQANLPPTEYYRQNYSASGFGQQAVSIRNVRGLVFEPDAVSFPDAGGSRFQIHLHLYGVPDTLASKDFLAVWHPSLDRRVVPGYLSWGDHTLSSSADKQFRIKNLSPTQTAVDIEIGTENDYSWYSLTPSPAGQILYSLNGDDWFSEITLGALGPDTVSPMIYMRRVTSADALLGSWSPRVTVDVGSWAE